MNAMIMRLTGACVLALALVMASATGASADFWGARKWPATNLTFPDECLHVGLNIATGSNPDKHNVEAVNACNTTEKVDILLDLFAADGSLVTSCFKSLNNRAQCQIQHSTPSGGWWYYEATMHSTEDTYTCSEFQNSYGSCFISQD